TTSWVATFLPSADISYQEMNTKSSSNSDMYLVYGNPILIQQAKDEAKRSKQQFATIPTKSLELHLFEMYIVPLFFLIGLFSATPLLWKSRIKGMAISTLILLIFIMVKILCLSLFEISNNRLGIYELGENNMQWLSTMLGVLSLGLSIILVFILWLIFGFRKSNFVQNFKLLFGNV
ncbi:MAG: hypothetical protein ABIO44_07835, partial [Saprospiraceae bacterium]